MKEGNIKEGPSTLKNQLAKDHKKRIDNGIIVTYKNGVDHLVSPGYSAVSVPALKTHLKNGNMGGLLNSL